MKLNLRLRSIVIAIATVFSFANFTDAQTTVPVHMAPNVASCGCSAPANPQYFEQGIGQANFAQQADFIQPSRLGFTDYMNSQYPGVGSPVDYTPELIGTYGGRADCATTRRIGVATVTDYALGKGDHSPLSENRIAQASYFQPVAAPQSVGGYEIEPGVGYREYAAAQTTPRFYDGGSNIGGGRSIGEAFWDPHWTRMVLAYGGFGFSSDNGSDVFDGRASTNLGIVGIDIGRRHSKFMRSSIDFTYRAGDLENSGAAPAVPGTPFVVDGDLKVYSLMKNFHLDLAQRGGFRPYIGVGIGAGVLDADANIGGEIFTVQDEVGFAYQIMGGVARNISDLASIYAEYRFFSLSDVDVATNAGPNEGGFTSHDVLFGLRFGY